LAKGEGVGLLWVNAAALGCAVCVEDPAKKALCVLPWQRALHHACSAQCCRWQRQHGKGQQWVCLTQWQCAVPQGPPAPIPEPPCHNLCHLCWDVCMGHGSCAAGADRVVSEACGMVSVASPAGSPAAAAPAAAAASKVSAPGCRQWCSGLPAYKGQWTAPPWVARAMPA
jgi:hypothetical protein